MDYRIVELTKADNTITYILEKEDPDNEFGWASVWRDPDLRLVREAKLKREQGLPPSGFKTRVVD